MLYQPNPRIHEKVPRITSIRRRRRGRQSVPRQPTPPLGQPRDPNEPPKKTIRHPLGIKTTNKRY
jgi:hypothetical protein